MLSVHQLQQWNDALLSLTASPHRFSVAGASLSTLAFCRPAGSSLADLVQPADCGPRFLLSGSNGLLVPTQLAASTCVTSRSLESLALLQQQAFNVPQIKLVPAGCMYLATTNKRSLAPELPSPGGATATAGADAMSYNAVFYSAGARGGTSSGNAPKRMRLSDEPSKPSRVLHIYGLPSDVTEAEIMQLTQVFGKVNNIILTRSKNQALVEMHDLEMAQQMVEYYSQVPARIRAHVVHIQFSNHEHLRVEQRPATSSRSSQEVKEDSSQVQTHNVLRIIVDNMLLPVTLDTLYGLFAKFGNVLRIITFTKNNSFHALVEFEEAHQAHAAKMSLNGQTIFHGCCSLHIDFSKLRKLSVRYNNDKSRDFTNDNLPNDEDPNACYGGAAMYAGFDGPRNGGSLFGAYPDRIPRHWPNAGFSSMVTNQPFGGPHQGIAFGSSPLFQQPASSPVLLVSNLNAEKVTPDILFTLFGVYGDVVRVKILFNKKDTALIQFVDSMQAKRAMDNLDFVRVWDKQMKLSVSKMHVVQMPKDGQPGAELTQDYSTVPVHKHRFRNPQSKNHLNIAPPAETLHLSNIPQGTTESELRTMFNNFGKVVDFKFFEKNPKMALIQMQSTDEAVLALIGLHNFQFSGSTYLGVSFTKKRMGQMNR